MTASPLASAYQQALERIGELAYENSILRAAQSPGLDVERLAGAIEAALASYPGEYGASVITEHYVRWKASNGLSMRSEEPSRETVEPADLAAKVAAEYARAAR